MQILHGSDSCTSLDSQEGSVFGDAVTLACDLILTVVSIFALHAFHTQVANGDYGAHWPLYLGFGVMSLNGLIGLIQFGSSNAICSMHCLFDYLQVVLVYPCYAAEIWTKYTMEPAVLANVTAGLGILPAVIFTAFEYKNQLITDLVILLNTVLLVYVGLMNQDYFVLLAAGVFVVAYFVFKRKEIVCDEPMDLFNGAMSIFTVLCLLSLGVSIPIPGLSEVGSSGGKSDGDGGGEGADSGGSEGGASSEENPPPEQEEPPPAEEAPAEEAPAEETPAEETPAEGGGEGDEE